MKAKGLSHPETDTYEHSQKLSIIKVPGAIDFVFQFCCNLNSSPLRLNTSSRSVVNVIQDDTVLDFVEHRSHESECNNLCGAKLSPPEGLAQPPTSASRICYHVRVGHWLINFNGRRTTKLAMAYLMIHGKSCSCHDVMVIFVNSPCWRLLLCTMVNHLTVTTLNRGVTAFIRTRTRKRLIKQTLYG